ncbi:MAG TPA: urea ABC transporter permease subunit UrtB [Tepidisphaeraceae bacterium]|nr:urea ABC transporter permease subunit UrtB [Tepidisphaeraceae bacterium]
MDGTVIRRLLISGLLAAAFLGASPLIADAQPPAPIPQDLIDALKSLRHLSRPSSDAAARQQVYDLINQKGDARLIPALKAYENGLLILQDGRLLTFGDRLDVPGQGSVLPMIDALTGQAVLGADGKPVYVAHLDLSHAIRAPPRGERAIINNMLSTLALLDPDPVVRLQSIRSAGARALRAFVDEDIQANYRKQLLACRDALAGAKDAAPALAAIDSALAEKMTNVLQAVPDADATQKIADALQAISNPSGVVTLTINTTSDYQSYLTGQQTALDELPQYSAALHRQLDNHPDPQFLPTLEQAAAELDSVLGDRDTRMKALATLGSIGTSDADELLGKFAAASHALGDVALDNAAQSALARADRYQLEVAFLENTFAGLSLGSILVLIALGLSIIFGLMGVINMAQGEFMMVGAFTTYVVSVFFQRHFPAYFNWYPLAAIPAAFVVSGAVGWLCEAAVIRHLYGRPLETLLATWGISLILIQTARVIFGDTLFVTAPSWMEGGFQVMPDLTLPFDRVYIIIFCMICIAIMYYVVNFTKLGLLLRATTQNRQMAASLGVPTRRVDALTFAIGAGLAGLAGVAVPLYNRINPEIGQEYIVDSFMVVVVGGVGTLGGAVCAGLGLGFLNKYLEPLLEHVPSIASGASVIGKVIVLAIIIAFLQWRPAGIFPPKGRMADG